MVTAFYCALFHRELLTLLTVQGKINATAADAAAHLWHTVWQQDIAERSFQPAAMSKCFRNVHPYEPSIDSLCQMYEIGEIGMLCSCQLRLQDTHKCQHAFALTVSKFNRIDSSILSQRPLHLLQNVQTKTRDLIQKSLCLPTEREAIHVLKKKKCSMEL